MSSVAVIQLVTLQDILPFFLFFHKYFPTSGVSAYSTTKLKKIAKSYSDLKKHIENLRS